MIECKVIQGCEIYITVRHSDNINNLTLFSFFYCLQNFNPNVRVVKHGVLDNAHHNDSYSMNAIMIAQPLQILSLYYTSREARLWRASLLRRPTPVLLTPAIPTPVFLTPTIPMPALLRLLRHTTEGCLMSRKVYSIGTP